MNILVVGQSMSKRRRRFESKYTLRDRFDLLVDKTNGCWNWVGSKSKAGYGQIRYEKKCHYAHRLSYEFFIGPLIKDMDIDHVCHNPGCVNPKHLRQITHKQNSENQLAQKGRSSIFRGVSYDKFRNKWKAYIKSNKKMIYLGRFDDEITASKVSKNARLKFFPCSTI